jgi:protein SCO1
LSFLKPSGFRAVSGRKGRVTATLVMTSFVFGGFSCRRGESAGAAYEQPRASTPGATALAVVASGDRPEPNKGIAVGEMAPDFTLTDQTGKSVRLSQLRGEPVAVTFVYTRCPDATACPMTMAKFAKLNAALTKEKLGRLLAVTVDPENDTPAALADYARKIGADPARWKFLTGDARSLARVAESFGVLYYSDHGKIVHTQTVAVLDPDGRLLTIYYGPDWEPEQILKDLEKARNG